MSRITDESTYYASVEFLTDPDAIPCACESCSWAGMASELNEIGDAILTPGHASPAGRCPECDTLAYVVQGDPLMLLREIEQALRDHPDVNVGNSKVHFAYMKTKAGEAIK